MVLMHLTLLHGAIFKEHHSPTIIPPWAATIILTNNYLESPLGQPFAIFFGTLISTAIGIGLTKLFMLNTENEHILWVCAALAVAISSVVLVHTKTLHPAAVSGALIAAIDKDIRDMGWFFLVDQIVCAILVILVACFFGNMYSKYPLFWVLPSKLKTTPNVAPPPDRLTKALIRVPHHLNSSTSSSASSSDSSHIGPFESSVKQRQISTNDISGPIELKELPAKQNNTENPKIPRNISPIEEADEEELSGFDNYNYDDYNDYDYESDELDDLESLSSSSSWSSNDAYEINDRN